MTYHEFSQRFFAGLLEKTYQFQTNNYDALRHNQMGIPMSRRIKEIILAFFDQVGFTRRSDFPHKSQDTLIFVAENLGNLQKTYDMLRDSYSRDIMVQLFQYRVLGGRRVKLLTNNAQYWQKYNTIDRYLTQSNVAAHGKWNLNQYKVPGKTNEISVIVHPMNILTGFTLGHYTYKYTDPPIQVEVGDVVIDGGGCWGDTALHFADLAGDTGRIYCFEFDVTNLPICERNLALNPLLAERIQVCEQALWDSSREIIEYNPAGPSTSLGGQISGATHQTPTLSIDDLVSQQKLDRVDFIKMDIEGAELQALKGAENTLKKFRPKLAISAYHKIDDLIVLPGYLDSLNLGYEFYLDHYTIHSEETVLFACSK